MKSYSVTVHVTLNGIAADSPEAAQQAALQICESLPELEGSRFYACEPEEEGELPSTLGGADEPREKCTKWGTLCDNPPGHEGPCSFDPLTEPTVLAQGGQ